MASFNKFNQVPQDLAHGVHNLLTGTHKFLLTNTAPVAANAVKADLTEISAGNGYSAGGVAASVSSSAQASGTYKLVLADPLPITASGGSIGPFRYIVWYNDTPTSPADPLLGYWDYGSSISLAAGESFQIDCDATTGVLQIV